MRAFPFLRFLLFICLFSLNANSYTPVRSAEASTGVTNAIVFVARLHLATKDDIFHDELGPARRNRDLHRLSLGPRQRLD
jgi:hypothetical protein